MKKIVFNGVEYDYEIINGSTIYYLNGDVVGESEVSIENCRSIYEARIITGEAISQITFSDLVNSGNINLDQ